MSVDSGVCSNCLAFLEECECCTECGTVPDAAGRCDCCPGCNAPPEDECECDEEPESYLDTARRDNPNHYH